MALSVIYVRINYLKIIQNQFTVLIFVFFEAFIAHTAMLPMSEDDLITDADQIIHGTVNQISSQWSEDRKFILTYVELQPKGVLKNKTSAVGPTVTVKVVGGTVDGVTLKVAGMPEFHMGEEVLVFLKKQKTVPSVLNLDQGKITLRPSHAKQMSLSSSQTLERVKSRIKELESK